MDEQFYIVLLLVLLLLSAIAWLTLWKQWRQERLQTTLLECKLRELENSMELQSGRFGEQNEQLEQVRRFRHDMRHLEAILHSCVRHGNAPELEEYLAQYSEFQVDQSVSYCANPAANILLQRYLAEARTEGAAVDAVLEIGEKPGITAPDLCVVIGNCLENAVESIRRSPEQERVLRIRAKETAGWLAIVLENSCPDDCLKRVDGGYLSSKEKGRVGIGLRSIQMIAQAYGGELFCRTEGKRFWTAVILFKKDVGV